MSGLPKYVVDAGGRKKFLRLKTEADFRAALRRNPNDLPVLHRYGLLLYNKKKDIPNAEMMFQRILEKAPDYTEALLDYGCLLWNRYRMADKDRSHLLPSFPPSLLPFPPRALAPSLLQIHPLPLFSIIHFG
jgi:tetratricopeptide (TPR) repeat protein